MDWDSLIASIAKTTCRKIGTLVCSIKFLSSEVLLYFRKSTIWPFVWNTVMMSGLVLQIAAEMRMWTCDPILAALLNLWFIMDI